MNLELTEPECGALVMLLRVTISADRYPMSPRSRTLRSILAKLEPSAPKAEPIPPPKLPGEPSMALRKGNRRR
jgi:hypothetical protein